MLLIQRGCIMSMRDTLDHSAAFTMITQLWNHSRLMFVLVIRIVCMLITCQIFLIIPNLTDFLIQNLMYSLGEWMPNFCPDFVNHGHRRTRDKVWRQLAKSKRHLRFGGEDY